MRASFRTVHEPSDAFGYVGHLCRDASRVWAVGGTYGKVTMLCKNGERFETKNAPKVNGLRDLIVSVDRLITCGESGNVFVSTDGAETWSARKPETSVCLFTLLRDSKGDIWLGGEQGLVRRSKNNAETWKSFALGTDVRVNVITQVGSSIYFACHDGTIFRYKRERIEKLKVDTAAPICSMVETKSGALLVCGDRGTLYRSQDGASWMPIDLPISREDLECVRQLADGTILVVGDRATVLASSDDGKSFAKVENPLQGHLWSICDSENGVYIGGDRGLIAEMEFAGL